MPEQMLYAELIVMQFTHFRKDKVEWSISSSF